MSWICRLAKGLHFPSIWRMSIRIPYCNGLSSTAAPSPWMRARRRKQRRAQMMHRFSVYPSARRFTRCTRSWFARREPTDSSSSTTMTSPLPPAKKSMPAMLKRFSVLLRRGGSDCHISIPGQMRSCSTSYGTAKALPTCVV